MAKTPSSIRQGICGFFFILRLLIVSCLPRISDNLPRKRAEDRDYDKLLNFKSAGRGGKKSHESESGLYISTTRRSLISTKFPMNLTPPTTINRDPSSETPQRGVIMENQSDEVMHQACLRILE
ncbi:hypothetical protein TorRG33x02_179390 [Trema orientale]|uniref:Uncharacterized protein n=1 Tax=Trema orientale TaxID=63057 RepID=A0A2P5EKZ5_TREOI|nr:hypothetical protein TorRG33x02_179390 [Trema orientale]